VNAEGFLDRIASRLGRPRRGEIGARPQLDIPTVPKFQDLAATFAGELEKVGGVCRRCADRMVLRRELAAVLDAEPRVPRTGPPTIISAIVTTGRTDLAPFGIEDLLSVRGAHIYDPSEDGTGADVFRARCASAEFGVTGAIAAVAETGSLVLGASRATPRCVSLLPRTHVALVTASQLVGQFRDVFVESTGHLWRWEGCDTELALPSQTILITGPSRTSDIENDLTIGVHGPAAVVVLILEDA
jgi:L-lactate dehydrogenase complex protein LldG